MKPLRFLFVILTGVYAPFSSAWSPFDRGFQEAECIDLFKKTYSVNLFVKATHVEKMASDKYEFTPVLVVRGEETPFTRQYCEYYTDEEMLYIGTAKSVIEAQRNKEIQEQKRKALAEKKRAEEEAAAAMHAAELKEIQDKAAAELAAELKHKKEAKLKQQQLVAEKRKAEAKELAKRHHADAIECVSNDAVRVKKQLLGRLPAIHRPDALHVEDQKISKVEFLKDATIMEVHYTFKLFSQTKFTSGWGSKSEPITLKSTGDIEVKPYSRSSAKATCALPRT